MEYARVLIVGAGAAGLSAASELRRSGFKKVKIFEARDREGGRVCSRNFDSGVIELGAQWIHGQHSNTVYDICKKNGLVDEECPHFLERFNEWHQLSDPVHKATFAEASTFILEQIDLCQKLSLDSRKSNTKVAQSLGHFLEDKFNKKFLDSEENEKLRSLYGSFFDWAMRLQNEINGCSNPREVSANYIGEYIECDGNNLTELGPRGYRGFMQFILKDVPKEWIFLKTPVHNIDYGGQTVKVTSSRGMEEFDHVITTIPLGVLKKEHKTLFSPVLPQRKQVAIDSIGFGVVDKIYLEYSHAFWQQGDVFQVLYLSEQKRDKWYHSIGRINAVRNQKNLLVCWIAGEGAKQMESLPDAEVMQAAHDVLSMVLDRNDLPKPKAVIRSTWFSDPYSQGSYSYISVDCDRTNSLPCDIAEPLLVASRPSVCFAGEASSFHYYSTVHGAYDTGVREARRLQLYYKQLNKVPSSSK